MDYISLHNGVKMPILGLGTDYLNDSKGQELIEGAISSGYRLIDTAQMYRNEAEVGAALCASGIKREEFFIVTKLLNSDDEASTAKSIEDSLKRLNMDYIDLLLIHHPWPGSRPMYRAMEDFYTRGILKSIGISNFGKKIFTHFVDSCCKVAPMVNQCETHLRLQHKKLREIMKPYKTVLQSWSPFVAGESAILKDSTLKAMGAKYGKSPAQIILRFLVEEGIQVIPRSFNPAHIRENFAIFDFALESRDIEALRGYDTDTSAFSWTNY